MLTEIKTQTEHYFVDKNGLTQGEYKNYHDNGQLNVHSFYLNGELHGEYNEYYDNGQPCIHCYYQNGDYHGEYKEYHGNGVLWEHCYYQYGGLHGEYKMYREDGTLDYATFCYQNNDLNINPDSLTEKDKTYIMLSGRPPQNN